MLRLIPKLLLITIGKIDEKKMDVKADTKTASKTIGKVDEKKMDVKADNKTATKTIGKVDEKKMDVKADLPKISCY